MFNEAQLYAQVKRQERENTALRVSIAYADSIFKNSALDEDPRVKVWREVGAASGVLSSTSNVLKDALDKVNRPKDTEELESSEHVHEEGCPCDKEVIAG